MKDVTRGSSASSTLPSHRDSDHGDHAPVTHSPLALYRHTSPHKNLQFVPQLASCPFQQTPMCTYPCVLGSRATLNSEPAHARRVLPYRCRSWYTGSTRCPGGGAYWPAMRRTCGMGRWCVSSQRCYLVPRWCRAVRGVCTPRSTRCRQGIAYARFAAGTSSSLRHASETTQVAVAEVCQWDKSNGFRDERLTG